ncbi:hypothetical protein BN1263170005 [Stenotrophomonas indicatrix]|nr:hypothetical protein BN1263170005 [Stenotrophomonas indicatrix]
MIDRAARSPGMARRYHKVEARTVAPGHACRQNRDAAALESQPSDPMEPA